MKTLTLQRLMVSFEETRHYHTASALLETDPERQAQARHLAWRAGAVLDAIRFELSARETRHVRTTVESQRADHYLRHLLEEFLDLREQVIEPVCAEAGAPPRGLVGGIVGALTRIRDEPARRRPRHA